MGAPSIQIMTGPAPTRRRAEATIFAMATAVSYGISLVASAGNQHYTDGPRWPATCPDTIAVAASGPTNAIAGYSNRGAGIDITAPGGALYNNDFTNGFYGAGEVNAYLGLKFVEFVALG